MKTVNEDIKTGNFRRCYLFYGEETYLKQQYKRRLRDAVLPDGNAMNLSVYEGRDIDVRDVIEQAQTLPFFAPRRLLILEESGFFKKPAPELAEALPTLPKETVLLFVEDEVDKRGKLYKTVRTLGHAAEFGVQNERTLTVWIRGLLKEEKMTVTPQALHLFLEKTGTDMERIRQELEKLISYCAGSSCLDVPEVLSVCSEQTENKVFDMIRAMTEKKQKRAMDLYYDLLALKEPPMRILFLIARQFNELMQVRELQMAGCDTRTIGERLKLADFVVRSDCRQAEAFSLQRLREAVEDCVETEEAVKTGRMNDVMSVELLLVKYSGAGETG